MAQSISFQDALALARSGNAEAQYAISSALHKRGQGDQSLYWLRLAAAQNLPQAQMTLAIVLMDGRQCPRDRQAAMDLLQPLAATQVQANLLLAELLGFGGLRGEHHEAALQYLMAAARLGDAAAQRQLALLCLCHQLPQLALPLLDAAARRGDGPATYALAMCHAGGIASDPDPALAAAIMDSDAASSQYLARPARLRWPQTPENARLITPAPLPVDWLLLQQALPQLASDLPLPDAQILHEAPLIRRLPAVIPPLVLDTLINLAAPLVQRSQIVDAASGEVRADPVRTSSHVTLGPRQHDHVLEALERCISRISGMPAANGEFLQILRYRSGEEFRPHVDYFNESGAGAYQSLADGGQRAQTVLLYLNDDYAGGSTAFPKLQLDIKAARGDMLHFHNLGADGLGHRDSLHAGLPVSDGEKWLLSQWIRLDSYPSRQTW